MFYKIAINCQIEQQRFLVFQKGVKFLLGVKSSIGDYAATRVFNYSENNKIERLNGGC